MDIEKSLTQNEMIKELMILSIMLDTLYSHILLLPMQPKLMRHSTSAS
jgi:hypothetical protein